MYGLCENASDLLFIFDNFSRNFFITNLPDMIKLMKQKDINIIIRKLAEEMDHDDFYYLRDVIIENGYYLKKMKMKTR